MPRIRCAGFGVSGIGVLSKILSTPAIGPARRIQQARVGFRLGRPLQVTLQVIAPRPLDVAASCREQTKALESKGFHVQHAGLLRLGVAAGRGATMDFTLLFLAVTIVLIAAWYGTRTLALSLFAATLLACIA